MRKGPFGLWSLPGDKPECEPHSLCAYIPSPACLTLLTRRAWHWQLAVYLDYIRDTTAETHLGFECIRGTAPTVCPCVHDSICLLSRANTVLSGDQMASHSGFMYNTYERKLAALSGPDCTPDCWKNVRPPPVKTFSCVCGQVFPSDIALDLHITSQTFEGTPRLLPRVTSGYPVVHPPACK
jgi:hypothetical protein